MGSQQARGDGAEPPESFSKFDVLFGAHQLIAGACREALIRYEEAAMAVSTTSAYVAVSSMDVEVAEQLRDTLADDIALLSKCVAQAEKRAEKIQAKEAGRLQRSGEG